MSQPAASPEQAALLALREARRLLESRVLEIDRLQAALRERESLLGQLSDSCPVILFRCWDAPGWPMLYMSRATERLTGYPAEAFVEQGLLFGELILAEDLPGLVAAVEQQLARQELFQSQYRIRRRDGSIAWIEVNSRRQRDARGRLYYEGTLTDITERQTAARLLAERAQALQRAQLATQAAQVAAFTAWLDRNHVEADPLAATLLGLAPGPVDGGFEPLLQQVHADDRDALLDRVSDLLARGDTQFLLDFRSVSASGRVRWVRAAGVLREDGGGRQAVGALSDVTLEIEVQRALEARTRETERANAELDDFTYVASHDLKEPLRGIHNYARFLAEDYADRLDEPGRQMLDALSGQAGRMQRLIEDLLSIARLGREPLHRQPVDLDTVLDEVLASLAFSLQERRVQLRRSPLGQADCDPVRVGEVFRNLVTNAVKYNDRAEPCVEIGRQPDFSGLPAWFVRDDGIGIKPEFHSRVFAPFKRLHGRGAYGGGSGMGLSLVRRIVDAHGGQIRLDSAPGEGATFSFTLQEPHA